MGVRGLLSCADSGDSNGKHIRAWKFHLQELTRWLDLPTIVCHCPPGGCARRPEASIQE